MSLVGWGAFFKKGAEQVLQRYIERFGEDELLCREADRIFSLLMNRPHRSLLAEVADLAGASGPEALSVEADHLERSGAAVARALAILGLDSSGCSFALPANPAAVPAARRNGHVEKEPAYFEHARPEVMVLVPSSAQRVLDLGCGAGRLGQALKQRQPVHVTGIELSTQAADLARPRLDRVIVADLEHDEFDFPATSFDCVVCADILEHLRQPESLLERIHGWLSPEGCLVTSLPNVRHHSVVTGLLEGNWTYEAAGLLDNDHVRFFTRREIQKLLFRAGFTLSELQIVPGPGYDEWVERGRDGVVQAGKLRLEGLHPEDAEEFYVYQYLALATPVKAVPPHNEISHLFVPAGQTRSLADSDERRCASALARLRCACPWPATKPAVPIPAEHTGWLADGAAHALQEALSPQTKLVIELGAWLGMSTRFILRNAPQATVICVDHWLGYSEHHRHPEWRQMLPTLYESFLAMCWEDRDRIIPLRMMTLDGLRAIADCGLAPQVIFFDAEHTYEALAAELALAQSLFPDATLVGDDYEEPGVSRAAIDFAERQGCCVETTGQAWRGWKIVLRHRRDPALSCGTAPSARTSSLPILNPNCALTSIIIVTHNELAYTHECVQSIRLRTDEPFELIFIDNGSTDGTIDYLRRVTGPFREASAACTSAQTSRELRGLQSARLIENPENRGFPAAVNQGIQIAQGQNILLLNNDTIVTTGWLTRLLAALESDERIGLVGPCSNNVSGPQQIAAGYHDLSSLDGFAWEHGLANHRRVQDTDRLVGFCLLFRRQVVERIGLFDERFGVGCFEDDDFCLRALQASFRAVIARDAFVHHYGSRTFVGSRIDLGNVLDANRQRFLDKWSGNSKSVLPLESSDAARIPVLNGRLGKPATCKGEINETEIAPGQTQSEIRNPKFEIDPDTHAARSSPRFRFIASPSAGLLLQPDLNSNTAPSSILDPPSLSGTPPTPLSLCMIVRDNETTIGPCLESIHPYVDEIVVVDTGSQDKTPDICRQYGARMFEFPWCDDFSAARNESFKHARGEWIFWMDSDDTISPECGEKLRNLVDQISLSPRAEGRREGGATVAKLPTVRERACEIQNPKSEIRNEPILGYIMQVHCPGAGEQGQLDVTIVDHVKLILNRADLRFEGRIHEQLLPAIRRAGGEVAWTDIHVSHSGSDNSPEGWQRKLNRDLRILHRELEEKPDHPFVLFNLGMTYADAGNHSPIAEFAKPVAELAKSSDPSLRTTTSGGEAVQPYPWANAHGSPSSILDPPSSTTTTAGRAELHKTAIHYLRRCLAVSTPDESHLRKAYALLVSSLAQADRHDEAWQTCQQGLALYPGDKELLFRSAMEHHHFGRLRQAEQAYLQVLNGDEERRFASIDQGLAGYKARHNLAIVYDDLGLLTDSEAQWHQILAEVPDYNLAWRALGENLLRQNRAAEAEQVADFLASQTGWLHREGHILRGRLAARRGDVEAAVRELGFADRSYPAELEPLRLTCRILFEQGDPAAARNALQELTERAPDDAAAFHNLGTMQFHQQQFHESVTSFEHSLKLRPNAPQTREQWRRALDCLGRRQGAPASSA
jgi:GT2 family glycosyltransferase/predicted TPR repeat methyltransferase